MTQTTSRRIWWGATAAAAALALGLTAIAGGQARSVPPPAADSPNLCVQQIGSRSWCGDDGPANRAKLAAPSDVAVAEDGSVLIADTVNNVVRRVRRDGTIVSIAGTGEEGSTTAGSRPAASIDFDGPRGVAAAGAGGVLVADTGNDAIRLISATGRVSTLAGPAGPIRADLRSPGDVTALGERDYLVADTGNNRVLRVTPDGAVVAIAGSKQGGYAGDGGPASAARLRRPAQVFAAPDGTVLIADTGNDAVRRVLPSGVIETVVGGLRGPEGVLGLDDGSVIAASAEGLRRVAPDGSTSMIAGGRKRGFNQDRGPALSLLFDGLAQIALRSDGRVLLAERESDRVRVLDAVAGTVDTVAGSGAPRPEPTTGIPAGAFPPELSGAGPPAAGARSSLARAAAASACERYDARFATFTLLPQTEGTLRVRRSRGRRGRRQIRLRFATSVPAKVVLEITRAGRPGGRTVRQRIRPSRNGNRIRVPGRFARRTYVARFYGLSLKGNVKRCDVKRVRVR